MIMMWYHFPSLRFRLAAINFGVTAIILIAMCGVILVVRSRELHNDLDERLAERAATIIDESLYQHTGPDDVHPKMTSWSGYFIQVTGENGQALFRSKNLGDRRLPPVKPMRSQTLESKPLCETITGVNAKTILGAPGEVRICTMAAVDQLDRTVVIQVAQSLIPVRRVVRNLRNTMLTVIAFGLAAAAAASWFVIGHMLAPLQAIARKADRLSITSLGERLGGGGRDEVSTMAASLDAMLDRLHDAFQAQDRFISAVSHELKTPLSILLGQAQVLARQTRDPEEYERFVTAVQDEARSLSRTVESLLVLAKAEAGLPLTSKSQVSVNEAVMDAVARCAPLADQREVKLAPNLAMPSNDQDEPIVAGDGEMLSLMVSNLVRNAVRYAPPDSTIDVQVATEDGYVVISVRDRGPGIPDEYIDRVFDRFFQVPKDSEAFKGIGIGLTLTRGIAELHGGSVLASNHPEGGCAFHVTLPIVTS